MRTLDSYVTDFTNYSFQKKSIIFIALDLPTSVDLATNKLIVTTLSGIAEFENN